MRIDLAVTAQLVEENTLRDRTVVAIDVLRATTSITTALQNGAREVIAVTTVEAAVKMSANLAADVVLLAGERNAKMIPGFQLGNSPLEYTADRVRGKSIVFSSTNGAQALARGRFARALYACAFVNVSAVAEALHEAGEDFIVVCAGTNGSFSLEDTVCAGMLIEAVTKLERKKPVLSDGAYAALRLHKGLGRKIPALMHLSEHGRLLADLGFEADLAFCAGVDTVPVLPQLDGNVLRLKRDADRKEPA